jgi:hypothetical protein
MLTVAVQPPRFRSHRTTLSPTLSLASNPPLRHHLTTFWRRTPPCGSRNNKFPAPRSPSTATHLPASFVHKDLHNWTHVFLHHDATRQALEPPYNFTYQVLSRREKTQQLFVRGKSVTVSADRVKPAYVLNDTDCGNTIFNPLASATPAIAPPATLLPPPATRTTRSGRHVSFPALFNT